jgi:NAD(P)-dependent dehydrogenase (short-subunit alcohol dehydrogenase family)
MESELENVPMHRTGKAEEIADMVSFLVLEGDYITETAIRVDDGFTMLKRNALLWGGA